MDKPNWDIADLLALADGESRAAPLDEGDPEVAAALARLRDIRSSLHTLPDVPVSDAVWESGLAFASDDRLGTQQNISANFTRRLLRFPLATAASVFFASIAGVYFLFGGAAEQHDVNGMSEQSVHRQFAGSTTQLEPGGLQLAGLMHRSQELERRLRGSRPLAQANWQAQASGQVPTTSTQQRQPSLVERRLMGRLADVDAQIGRLYDAQQVDLVARQRLWTQRVVLLESLVSVSVGHDIRRYVETLSPEDMRSM